MIGRFIWETDFKKSNSWAILGFNRSVDSGYLCIACFRPSLFSPTMLSCGQQYRLNYQISFSSSSGS